MLTTDIKAIVEKLDYDDSLDLQELVELHIEDLQAAIREPIPDYGENIPFSKFIDAVLCHAFCRSDGHGYYSTESEMSKLPFRFYDDRDQEKCQKYGFTHVIWFNK